MVFSVALKDWVPICWLLTHKRFKRCMHHHCNLLRVVQMPHILSLSTQYLLDFLISPCIILRRACRIVPEEEMARNERDTQMSVLPLSELWLVSEADLPWGRKREVFFTCLTFSFQKHLNQPLNASFSFARNLILITLCSQVSCSKIRLI